MDNSTTNLSSLARDVINFQYAVMFGVIGNLAFAFEKGPPPGVVFTVKEHWIEFAIFLIYFLLDWWTANVRSFDEIRSLAGLFVRVVWIGFLGATIVFLNSQGWIKYLLVLAYTFGTGAYDVITTARTRSPHEVIELLIAVPRLLFACLFFIPVLSGVIGRGGILTIWEDCFWFFGAAYVGLKVARTNVLRKATT